MSHPDSTPPVSQSRARFATTQWSLIVSARNRNSPRTREALAALCDGYWPPLYAFIRRQGFDPEEARDLTQEFFARLLEKDYLQSVDRGKGRFRSFLLASCRHFLSNERDRARAVKRGGGRVKTLDLQSFEAAYAAENADGLTAEKMYERQWTISLLNAVLARLREELAGSGKGRLFDCLKPCLTDAGEDVSYKQAAEALGVSVGAAKVAAHRLRRRYRELLRDEIERTLDDPSEIDDEIKSLFAALS